MKWYLLLILLLPICYAEVIGNSNISVEYTLLPSSQVNTPSLSVAYTLEPLANNETKGFLYTPIQQVITIPVIPSGGGGGAPFTPSNASNISNLTCPVQPTFYKRLIDTCNIENNGICEDAATPLSHDCEITTSAIDCVGSRCVFTEMWFAKLLLLLLILILLYYRPTYNAFIVIIISILTLGFGTDPLSASLRKGLSSIFNTPQDLSNPTVSAIMQSEFIKNLGGLFSPSHYIIAFIFVCLFIYVIFSRIFIPVERGHKKDNSLLYSVIIIAVLAWINYIPDRDKIIKTMFENILSLAKTIWPEYIYGGLMIIVIAIIILYFTAKKMLLTLYPRIPRRRR